MCSDTSYFPHTSMYWRVTLSDDTINVLNFLEQASTHGLRKRNDLGLLLELAASGGRYTEINDLSFHGRHLHGLYTVLRKTGVGSEGYAKLEREFHSATEVLRDHIAALLIEAATEDVERFNSVYYALTQGSLRNLLDLSHDLGVLKSVQNDQKHGRSNKERGG